MTHPTTLGDFFQYSELRYQVFDIGRRVVAIDLQQFEQFEQAIQPYPYPMQQQAMLALVLSPAQSTEPYIWFLSFPLDEQGLLIQASRDHFLKTLIERILQNASAQTASGIENAAQDSPYIIKPYEDKMAVVHAKVNHQLQRQSPYYQETLAYYVLEKPSNDWPSLVKQGIADLAIYAEGLSLQQSVGHWLSLPDEPVISLCHSLENRPLPLEIMTIIQTYFETALQQKTVNMALLLAYLRAVSYQHDEPIIKAMIEKVLTHRTVCTKVDVFATIAGRLWSYLREGDLCRLFLTKLAENDAGQAGFSHIVADLVFMPNLRTPVMSVLRSTERSEALTQCVGKMFMS